MLIFLTKLWIDQDHSGTPTWLTVTPFSGKLSAQYLRFGRGTANCDDIPINSRHVYASRLQTLIDVIELEVILSPVHIRVASAMANTHNGLDFCARAAPGASGGAPPVDVAVAEIRSVGRRYKLEVALTL